VGWGARVEREGVVVRTWRLQGKAARRGHSRRPPPPHALQPAGCWGRVHASAGAADSHPLYVAFHPLSASFHPSQ
jgi:predicted alpha/beta-hydrolase family hydrolase